VDAPLSASPGAAPFSLIFPVDMLPMSSATYAIKAPSKVAPSSRPTEHHRGEQGPGDGTLENEVLKLTFAGGYLQSIYNKVSNITNTLTQQFYWWRSGGGDFGKHNPSGAYIFRPNGTDPYPVSQTAPTIKFTSQPGDVVQEARITVCDWISQTVRLYAGQQHAEFEWRVGPIPWEDLMGKEIISRFSSNIASAQLFYTDSNGREMQKRQRDFRPTWKWNKTEPVAGNYYPVNALAFIKDQTSQLTVLTDRSQGASSLADGQLEFMIHRRILEDDWRGVGEPLNETDGIQPYPDPQRLGKGLIIVGKHYLLFDQPLKSARLYRPLASRIFSAPIVAFSQLSDDKTVVKSAPMARMPAEALPMNVDLMTCQILVNQPPATVLIRLSHMYAAGEDSDFARPVNVSIQSIFPGQQVSNVQELSLTANQARAAMSPIPAWHIHGERRAEPIKRSLAPAIGDDFVVTLNPMEIRTYSLSLT
jgi:lysosomal alpha-mannosidase